MSQANRCRRSAAVFAICVLVACSSAEERFAERVGRAEQLTEAGETEDAILEYRSALKINPDDSNANEQLGNLLLRRGDLDAVYYFDEAIRLDPGRIDIAMRLAQVLLVAGRTDEAEKVIDAALAVQPEAAVVYITQAELFLYRNDPERALAAALKATELDPDDPSAWLKLGRVHEGRIRMAELEKKRPKKAIYGEALAAFERADELAGGLVTARIERARLLGARGKTRDRTRRAFADAIELAKEQEDDVQHFAAASAAAEYADQMNKKNMQIWALRQMLEADDSRLDLWQKLARRVGTTSDFEVVIYKQLLRKRPDDVGAHLMFASYLASEDHVGKAIKYLRDVIERDLGSPLPWERLIRLQILKGRIANARAAFVRMSDEYPDDPVTQRTEARIALAEGRTDDAAEIMRAVAAQSENFETQQLLAIAEYRNRNLPNAAAAVDRALALRADFAPETMRLKARIHHDSEEWAAVLRALTRIARNGKPLSDADKLMSAHALYGLGRPQKGAAVLEQILAGETPPGAAAVEYARREGDTHPEQAAAHLAAALTRAPANPEILEELVEIDLRKRNVKAALFRLNAAIDSGRARPRTLLLRARVLIEMGAQDRAEADALRAFEADPSLPGGVDTLYAIYEAQGRLDEARTSFEEAEAAGVLHSGARLLLGRIYLRQGESGRAREMFEKVLHDDPNATGAKIDLANLLAENDRELDRALQLSEEAQQSMSTDPDAAHAVGYVYFRKGLHEAALRQFLRALELSEARPGGREPTLRYHLGLTLDALHRNEEAVDAFEKALAIDSDFPDAADARRRLEAARRPSAASATGAGRRDRARGSRHASFPVERGRRSRPPRRPAARRKRHPGRRRPETPPAPDSAHERDTCLAQRLRAGLPRTGGDPRAVDRARRLHEAVRLRRGRRPDCRLPVLSAGGAAPRSHRGPLRLVALCLRALLVRPQGRGGRLRPRLRGVGPAPRTPLRGAGAGAHRDLPRPHGRRALPRAQRRRAGAGPAGSPRAARPRGRRRGRGAALRGPGRRGLQPRRGVPLLSGRLPAPGGRVQRSGDVGSGRHPRRSDRRRRCGARSAGALAPRSPRPSAGAWRSPIALGSPRSRWRPARSGARSRPSGSSRAHATCGRSPSCR